MPAMDPNNRATPPTPLSPTPPTVLPTSVTSPGGFSPQPDNPQPSSATQRAFPHIPSSPTSSVGASEHGRSNTPTLGASRIPPPGNFSPGGMLSPTSQGSAASFVFPVRSMLNVGGGLQRQSSIGGGSPTHNSPRTPMNFPLGLGADRPRSPSVSTTQSEGMPIGELLNQGDSISQMLEQAANSSAPAAQQGTFKLGGGSNQPQLSPISDNSAEAPVSYFGIKDGPRNAQTARKTASPSSSPLASPNPSSSPADAFGYHDTNTYMLSPRAPQGPQDPSPLSRASSTAQEMPSSPQQDLEVVSPPHAPGQVDPTPKASREEQPTAPLPGNQGYVFRDRPGPSGQQAGLIAPKPQQAVRGDQLDDVAAMGRSGEVSPGTEGTLEGVKVKDTAEGVPDQPVGQGGQRGTAGTDGKSGSTSGEDSADSIPAPSDMGGIVRLGPARDAMPSVYGSGSTGPSADGVPATTPGTQSATPGQPRLKRSRHESVDHQASVQTFVNSQSLQQNMSDPNAPTPAPPSPFGSRQPKLPADALEVQSDLEDNDEDRDNYNESSAGEEETGGSASADNQLSVMGSGSDLTASKGSSEPVLTARFEHVTTDEGHHVLIGREGKLERCEDEPITTPGAVQGYGVLMVLEENDETGDLIVRQVSENATELLGLSPRYLFRLQCFTHILPRSQDDILRDNIDYLPDPEMDSAEVEEEGPQVFLLSGYGEPGSVDSDEPVTSRTINRRREWTCWVAAHRPGQKNWNRVDEQGKAVPPPNLIVMEFELEGDPYNPLYPPMKVEVATGTESPGSNSGAGTSESAPSASSAGPSSSAQAESAGSASLGSRTEMGAQARAGSGTSTATDSTLGAGAGGSASSSGATMDTAESQEPAGLMGLEGDDVYIDPADILESTTSHARPLRALERMRRMTRTAITAGGEQAYAGGPNIGANPAGGAGRRRNRRAGQGGSGGVGTMDVFAVLAQINDQLGNAPDVETFLKIVVGVIKDLTQFHRCLIYSFDGTWNGQVVAELVDWSKTHDLYKGLMFPASDIPPQARDLYRINKVRLLYDRDQPTARMVLRYKEDLENPLDMTHGYLRAMSPIHLVYLKNMGVRSSMSVSIMAFGQLWGLIACHSYGDAGMRVSFPVRQMLRLLSDSISRNIERLSYAARLHTRKLISTIPTDAHPTGYIVSNADDLIQLFDADSGVLVIGDGAKILGPSTEHGQEILLIAEFLRLKRYEQMQVTHNILDDFPELRGPKQPEVLSGLLYVPLSAHGNDFIAFLRKGQLREVHWAGKPYKEGREAGAILEPRQSFKVWSETIAGRARVWSDEQLETAGVLALVYGKFIEVWRQKESAIRTNQMTSILLTNASHEVRTPLNHIINYLELALDGQLDSETRENLSRSHMASKSLLFTINDLLDLTRIESGNETAFNDPFDLKQCIQEATNIYKSEATRKGLEFVVDTECAPSALVLGDLKKVRTAVANLVANAVKYTTNGTVQVTCRSKEAAASQSSGSYFRGSAPSVPGAKVVDTEIIVSDTGSGIEAEKLEAMFVTFEQADSVATQRGGLGLGLAVVARIVEQLGGQLKAESEHGVGTRFFISLQMAKFNPDASSTSGGAFSMGSSARPNSHSSSGGSVVSTSARSHGTEIDTFVEAFSQSHMSRSEPVDERILAAEARMNEPGTFPVTDSSYPVRPQKVDMSSKTGSSVGSHSRASTASISSVSPPQDDSESPQTISSGTAAPGSRISANSPKVKQQSSKKEAKTEAPPKPKSASSPSKLRILVVEDDDVNRKILERRLRMDGHTVLSDINGQEALDRIKVDQKFDCILMDIQMPIMDGRQSAEAIRKFEATLEDMTKLEHTNRRVHGHIPIIAVSASLLESQQAELGLHFDGWMLKPVDFKRMLQLLSGLSDLERRKLDIYKQGHWERGGWLNEHAEPESHPSTTLEK